MDIWQHWKVWGLDDWAADALRKLPDEQKPTRCTACGACEEKCPNQLDIRQRLEDLCTLL